jgi:hypothetical protein
VSPAPISRRESDISEITDEPRRDATSIAYVLAANGKAVVTSGWHLTCSEVGVISFTLEVRSMRIRAVGLCVVCLLWSVLPAAAQRVEVSGIYGWTLSDGIQGDTAVIAGDGNIYDTIASKDSQSWGFGVGVLATDQSEVGFLFNQQLSTLEISGTDTLDVGDLTVNTYHGYFAYNFGDRSARARPYVMIGLGATNYGSVDFFALGAERQTPSQTQFSSTWGAGIKVFPSQYVGARFGFQWTPTYLRTEDAGWWCDPFWGCYVVGDAKYSNQFRFEGGITARF